MFGCGPQARYDRQGNFDRFEHFRAFADGWYGYLGDGERYMGGGRVDDGRVNDTNRPSRNFRRDTGFFRGFSPLFMIVTDGAGDTQNAESSPNLDVFEVD
jgi:hypothetical protein